MPTGDVLLDVVSTLVDASTFEDAATAVLDGMFRCVEAAIRKSDGPVRLLRGTVHLRPDGTYERLYGVDRSTGAALDGPGFVVSGNVWVWVARHACSVSIDVQRQSMRAWLRSGMVERLDGAQSLPSDATRERWLGREATHIHVVPLRSPGGIVLGMFALELNAKPASSDAVVWERIYDDLDVLAAVGSAFLTARSLPSRAPATGAAPDGLLPVLGESTRRLTELLRAFAPLDDTILITGPTGAGKSRLARWCHQRSGRDEHPFETLDVHAVPEDLQMAEIFGWKRGAFTGAVRDTPGAIARAGKGTLFLDEIDKLSLKSQAGLLHFLESRAYRMLGDDQSDERRSDARLIVASNVDLADAVRRSAFREDLYYRINVLPLRVAALGDRVDEIPLWAEFMLQRRHAEKAATSRIRFAAPALQLLAKSPWPGNLRQLDNIVRRAYALHRSHGGANDDAAEAIVARDCVQQALDFDGLDLEDGPPHTRLVEAFNRLARAFVSEAERRAVDGRTLSLEVLDGLRGLVLGNAVAAAGTRDDAFRWFGMEALVKNRNHNRTLRRELARSAETLRELGAALEPTLQKLSDDLGDKDS